MSADADRLARILARSGDGWKVRRAAVKSASGDGASCVMAGDAGTVTGVELAGTPARAGDSIVCIGKDGRWYAIGNCSRKMADAATVARGVVSAPSSAKEPVAWELLGDGRTVHATMIATGTYEMTAQYGSLYFETKSFAMPVSVGGKSTVAAARVSVHEVGGGLVFATVYDAVTDGTSASDERCKIVNAYVCNPVQVTDGLACQYVVECWYR